MLDFLPVAVSCRESMLPYLKKSKNKQSCDLAFGNLFCWGEHENTRYVYQDGFLFLRSTYCGVRSYAFPFGEGDLKNAFSLLEKDAKDRNAKFIFYNLSKEEADLLKDFYGERVTVTPKTDFFDYIYSREELALLKGRKYHKKKNHVNTFEKMYSYSYEELNEKNLDECFAFSKKWHKAGEETPLLIAEEKTIEKSFSNFFDLQYSGALLRVEGNIVAYCMGEESLDENTYITHYEKADVSLSASYAMMNHLFAENSLQNYTYINREDDLGLLSLRKAKQSYNPVKMVEKYDAEIK